MNLRVQQESPGEASRTRGERWLASLEKEQDRDRNLFGSLLGGNKGAEDKSIKEITQGGQVVLDLTFACMSGRTERGARNMEETGEEQSCPKVEVKSSVSAK